MAMQISKFTFCLVRGLHNGPWHDCALECVENSAELVAQLLRIFMINLAVQHMRPRDIIWLFEQHICYYQLVFFQSQVFS